MSTIQKYWRQQAKVQLARHDARWPVREAIVVIDSVVCRDGFRLSVQASAGHYSQPRGKTLKTGRYTCWEVLADKRVRGLKAFACGVNARGKRGDDGHYSFVPTKYVDEVIARHGGLKEHDTP